MISAPQDTPSSDKIMFGKSNFERKVILKTTVRDSIISYCKMNHPNEGLLILQGKSKKGTLTVNGLIVPPFSESGPTFAGFPHSFLPFDLSYIGTVHSHPTGPATPSITDLNNFFGLVSIIVKSPYENDDIFAWNSKGEGIPISVS